MWAKAKARRSQKSTHPLFRKPKHALPAPCVSLTGGRGAASLRTPTTLTRHHDTRLRPPRVTKKKPNLPRTEHTPPRRCSRAHQCVRCTAPLLAARKKQPSGAGEITTRANNKMPMEPSHSIVESPYRRSRRTADTGETLRPIPLPPSLGLTNTSCSTYARHSNTEHKRQLNCGNQPTTEALLRRQQHRKPPHSGPKTLMIHRRTSDQDAATKNKPSLRWAKTRLAALRSFLPLRGELRPPH